MSNEIYPLDEFAMVDVGRPVMTKRRRSVNERLTPIFRALADDPEGYEQQAKTIDGQWVNVSFLPENHCECSIFRLVPKRRTITVEIPVPERISEGAPVDGCMLVYKDEENRIQAEKAIRSAMEGK